MTKIILLKTICFVAVLIVPALSISFQNQQKTLRIFPYVMPPQPFIGRQTRDVGEIHHNMINGENENNKIIQSQNQNNGNQLQTGNTIQDQESQHSIRSEQLLTMQPPQYYISPPLYQNYNNISPQQQQNIIQRALETEKVNNNGNYHEYNNQNLQQQNQISSYAIPQQTFNHLQSIYQNQQQQSYQPTVSQYNANNPTINAPYPPKMDIQPSYRYLPSMLQSPVPPSTPAPPVVQHPTTPPIPSPMVIITPKPQLSKTYLPVKPTKSVITNIYSYDSPTDLDEETNDEPEPEPHIRQHYKILFIKAPSQINRNIIRKAHAQQQHQQKTVVYILSKKTDVNDIHEALHYLPTTTTKPEVHFIRYKTEDEAEHAKHQIQNHYHSLSDSTQYSNEGIPPISSAIGLVPNNENSETGYLPPSPQNNDLAYLPPSSSESQSANLPDQGYLPSSK